MGRVEINPLLRACLHPSAKNAATWKDERMGAGTVDYGQLEIAVERCRGCRLPHSSMFATAARRKH